MYFNLYAFTLMPPLPVCFYNEFPLPVCFYTEVPVYLYASIMKEVPFTCMLFAVLWVRTCRDRSSVNSPSSMLIFSTSSTRFFIKMFFLALSIIKVHP